MRDAVPETLFLNSHDGTSAYQLRLGLYRTVCTNGLVVSAGTFPILSVAHRGDMVADVVRAALHSSERFEALAGSGSAWNAPGWISSSGIRGRLVAALEARMLGTITVLVNVPKVAAAPTSLHEWTWLRVDVALGAAWLVSGAQRDAPCSPIFFRRRQSAHL